ncbi:PAS domain-containing protein [Sulfidibacter corallicola]|uniref:PAS domain-containing protein n=1 Tax=Sulfidibacter corallicola TaxID=2818388 RepID=A0A8A4TM81_SULCO|nr:histidine kinase dimerization/phosphoacceptor domain -containing protein [Sulfidibacter corallicola]QTD50577.1 PAS domain-containing protein [Sulfidibacter corallicola]
MNATGESGSVIHQMADEIKVLMVEDDPEDAHLIRTYLEKSRSSYYWGRLELFWVTRLDEALSELAQGEFQLILLDLNLPDGEGIANIEMVRQHAHQAALIVLTGFDEEPVALDAMRHGAQDFLIKGEINERNLYRVFFQGIERHRLVTRLNEQLAQHGQALKELARSEELFRLITETIREVFWISSPDGQEMHYCSQRYEETWGRPVSELLQLPMTWMECVVEQDRPAVEKAMSNLAGGGYDVEYRIRRPDGEVSWIRDRGFPSRSETGEVERIVGLAEDITDIKRSQEEVLKSRHFFHDVLDSLTAPIGVLDRHGKLEAVNRAWNRLRLYSPLVGSHIEVGCHYLETCRQSFEKNPDSLIGVALEKVLRSIEGVLDGSQEGDLIQYGLGAPPADAWFQLKITRASSGRVILAHEAITDQKRAEIELRRSLVEKDALLREVHHRVKNNLQIIASLLFLQSKHIQHPETIQTLLESQNRIRSMAMIHEMLYRATSFSQIDFCQYVRQLVGVLVHLYHRERIPIEVPHSLVNLTVEKAVPCGLVVNELVTNALKHAFPDGRQGRILVRLEEFETSYRIEVEDEGIGIREDILEQDIQSLGLKLVDVLVKQLHGTWEFVPAEGTFVRIEFPK